MIGQTIGHYQILAKLGEGGMGEVYRATDTTLGRDVALKVLPATLARDPARIERFRREARAVAALNHPHIVTIYSVEHAEGVHFLTMELVEGESLDRKVMSTGLPVGQILTLAMEIADALAAAHEKGIVHRDLKPGNIMVTAAGRVKVLDFGLAKMAADSASEQETIAQTSEGVVLGTMPYMSPEQVEGRAVDARTDIFSLGVVLYELSTGSRPFAGRSQAALVSAILRDTPAVVTARRQDIPSELGRLISRCLEKDRERRLQTAKDVRNEAEEIRRVRTSAPAAPRVTAAAAPERASIVVIPFANLSPDPENEYFSDGLTEEIIADLSKVKALRVISRTSSMQLKGGKKDVRTIGRELDVRYVLDGSVRKAGNSLRITAQLIEAATDAHVWSEKYSGTIDDVFEVQERVSREIVKALDITLTSDEHRELGERPTHDVRAFQLFLQARQELRRYAPARAVALFGEAIRIEGETPALMSILTAAKVAEVRAGVGGDRNPLDEAEREARDLLARVPGAPYGHSLLGQVFYERGRLTEAVQHCRVAIERQPNDSDTGMYLWMALIAAGQDSEMLDAARQMVAYDPLSPFSSLATGVSYWFIGQAEQGIPDIRKALEIDPQNLIAHWAMGYTYAQVGRLDDAARHARIANDLAADVVYTRQVLALVDGLEGRSQAALDRIAAIDVEPLDAHQRFHLAESFIAAGAIDRGMDLLERSVSGFHPYPYLATYCRFLDPVRGTPRFDAVLAEARQLTDAFPKTLLASA